MNLIHVIENNRLNDFFKTDFKDTKVIINKEI
jgi:hypothetical protein